MDQQPIFIKYRRQWLSEVTGFSQGYLSKIATGHYPITRSFIERSCFALQQPEEALFLPNSPKRRNRQAK